MTSISKAFHTSQECVRHAFYLFSFFTSFLRRLDRLLCPQSTTMPFKRRTDGIRSRAPFVEYAPAACWGSSVFTTRHYHLLAISRTFRYKNVDHLICLFTSRYIVIFPHSLAKTRDSEIVLPVLDYQTPRHPFIFIIYDVV
jgi:hypothetical protein